MASKSDHPKPDGRRGESVVAAILDATLEELAHVGFTAMSVEGVAARAGVNKTTVYRRYPSKVELTAAALLRERDAIGDVDTGSLGGDLRSLLLEGCKFVHESRGQSVFRMLLGDRANPEVARLADQMRREGERVPRRVFQRAIARGELSPDVDMSLLVGMVIGNLVHRVLLEGGTLTADEVDTLVSMILNGVGTRSAGPKRKVGRTSGA